MWVLVVLCPRGRAFLVVVAWEEVAGLGCHPHAHHLVLEQREPWAFSPPGWRCAVCALLLIGKLVPGLFLTRFLEFRIVGMGGGDLDLDVFPVPLSPFSVVSSEPYLLRVGMELLTDFCSLPFRYWPDCVVWMVKK